MRHFHVLTAILFIFGLSACGGGGGGGSPPPPPATYNLSGFISGATLADVTIVLDGRGVATTDSDGNYNFSKLSNGDYIVIPVKDGYTFNPLYTTVSVSGADVSGTNFVATPNIAPTYTLFGAVTGAVSENVLVTLSGAADATVLTSANGSYGFSGLTNGNYTITPALTGYTFNPASDGATISDANTTVSPFDSSAVPVPTYSISGAVGGATQAGISITLTGTATASTTTDSGGHYIFSSLNNGSYTVTPSKTGYSFSPTNSAVNVSNANVGSTNFTAAAIVVPTYGLSGTVTGAVLQNVLITLSGAGSASTLTNGSGNYSFSGVVNGNYTATPSLTGYTFNPVNAEVTISGANAPVGNFVAIYTPATFSLSTVTDPLAFQQWGLRNTAQTGYADTKGTANTGGTLGTDINANPVYSNYGYTGLGVTVAVVDTGLEVLHEDLSANVVSGGSWNFINSSTDPTNAVATTGDHGTSVSGLIAMALNDKGGIGVAPKVQLKGFNVLLSSQSNANYIAALGGSTASPNSSDVAIFNQSFGTNNTTVRTIDPALAAQYVSGTSSLRGGKGALYVKSAGNGYTSFGTATCSTTGGNINCCAAQSLGVSCQNVNFDPSNVLPYNIVMAALNAKGKKSSYSTAGSALWASAPGGEGGYNASVFPGLIAAAYDPAMVTTDQSNCSNGYSRSAETSSLFNQGGSNLSGINFSCNYTNGMNGTSSAAPMMSGVIALILEANPALTWREVKDILARTAVKVNAGIAPVTVVLGNGVAYVAERAWVTNAAGRPFHNWYGFGAVNASAAVNMAKTYVSGSLGAFANTGWIRSGTLSLAIADNSTVGASTTLTVSTVGTSGKVEAVQIKVSTANAVSGWAGDLGIELTSPSGTRSILKNIKDGFAGSSLTGMVLASNAFYGESSAGIWTIKVLDGWVGGTQTLTNAQIRVYGH